MTRGTARLTRYSGPYLCQWLPLRLPAFQATYCRRLVRAARVIPKLMEWAKDLAPAVAVIPRTPASRSGQHQLPTAPQGYVNGQSRPGRKRLYLEDYIMQPRLKAKGRTFQLAEDYLSALYDPKRNVHAYYRYKVVGMSTCQGKHLKPAAITEEWRPTPKGLGHPPPASPVHPGRLKSSPRRHLPRHVLAASLRPCTLPVVIIHLPQ